MTGLWIFTRIRIFTDTIKEMEATRTFLSLTDYYNDYSTLRRIFSTIVKTAFTRR